MSLVPCVMHLGSCAAFGRNFVCSRLVFVRLLFLSYPWVSLGSLAIEGVATCALSRSPKQEGWPKASTTYISLTLKKHLLGWVSLAWRLGGEGGAIPSVSTIVSETHE